MPFNPLPPNSFASLKQALENGADGVEIDVQITSDNKLVLFHDKTINNLPGLSGAVSSVSSNQLIGAHFKIGFPYDMFQNEAVISFRQWIKYAAKLKEIPYLQIDIKTNEGQSEESKYNLLQQINLELLTVEYPLEKVIAISPDRSLLLKLHEINSKINLAYEPGEFESGLNWALANNCSYLILDNKFLTNEKIEKSHQKGVGVIAFGGKSRSTLVNIINMRPVFVQSNNVSLMTELLK